jgi:hypothetical protein
VSETRSKGHTWPFLLPLLYCWFVTRSDVSDS